MTVDIHSQKINLGGYKLYTPIILIAVLIASTQINFLLFHTLAEFVAIVIAMLFSVVAWQMYPYTKNHYLMFLGIAYFWIATLDLVHTLSYKGMLIIEIPGVNSAVQYWIGARYMEAFAWLIAPFFLTRRLNTVGVSLAFASGTAIIILAVVIKVFPLGFIPGKGLTEFKVYSEYAIVGILLLSSFHHHQHRQLIDARIYKLLMCSIGLTIAAEVAFTLYIHVYGISNVLGHLLKLLSFWVLFIAVVKTHLSDPFSALSRSATHYDAVPDATIIVDRHGTIMHVNQSACRLSNKTATELVGLNHHDVFHQGYDNPVDTCPVCLAINKGEALSDCELAMKNGLWLDFSTSIIEGGDSFVEVIRNISDKKRIKTLLEKSQEVANIGSWEYEPPSGSLIWSKQTYHIFGVDYDTPLSYKLFLELIHPEDRELVNERYMSSVREKLDGYEVYHRIIDKKTNKISYLFEKCMHVKDNKGVIVRSTGMTFDLTELRLAQLNVEQKEREQKLILDSMVVPIITINSKGIILFFNQAAQSLFGYSKEEVIGHNVKKLMPEQYANNHDQYLKNYQLTGDAKIFGKGREVDILTKSRELIPAHLSISQLKQGSNEEPIFIGSVLDLTDTKKKDEQIRRTSKLDALGKLTGGIAHDFNNMLGVIQGFIELMKQEIDPSSSLFEYLENINNAASRGTSLTKKLLSFTRSRAEEKRVTIISELISNEKIMLQKTLTPSVEISVTLHSETWPVMIDDNEFVDVILNLCINAKHAMDGAGKISVNVYNKTILEETTNLEMPAGDYVCVEVADNGHGMSQEVIQKIFDPFYSTKGELGTGLGLAQVYGFMKRSNGYIDVLSKPEEGALFTLYFPRCTTKKQETKPKPNAKVTNDILNMPGARILIVDDEIALAAFTCEILKRNGYKPVVVENAASAMEQLDKSKFDLVVSDVIMPEISGLELKQYISEKHPKTPVILVSGFNEEFKNLSSLDNFIPKPFNSKQLLEKVNIALDYKS